MLNDTTKLTPTHVLSNFFARPINLLGVENKLIQSRQISEGVNWEFEDRVLYKLKHMNLRGIRVEAKGRLTRRATASRSVFKMR
jgi:hypothetical protein